MFTARQRLIVCAVRWLGHLCALVAVTCLWSVRASAQEDDEASAAFDVDIHAFVSQGFLVSSHNNYLANSKRGSFEFTEVGINFTKPIGDNLRLGLQLFARDLGPVGRYNARLDWFYLDYRYADWLGLRAGRVKLPFGLYNEYNDIDAGRTTVLMPQSVYPTQNREFLLAQTGVEIYGRVPLGEAGALDYRLYGGTVYFEVEPQADTRVDNIQIPYVAGARLLWDTPLPGLRLGASVQALRLEGDIQYSGAVLEMARTLYMLGPTWNGLVKAKIPAVLWVASAEYAWRDLILAAEYSRWHTDLETDIPLGGLPRETSDERAYVSVAYRLNSWMQPGIYYSLLFPNVEQRSGKEHQQHDVAATLRFDVNSSWLVKLEGHYMNGTAALSSNLNDGVPLSRLTRQWLLVLAKTTVYF